MENVGTLNNQASDLNVKSKCIFGEIKAELNQWTADWHHYGDEIAGMSLEDYLEYKRVRKNAFWSARFEALPNNDLDRLTAIYRAVRRKHLAFLREVGRIREVDAAAAMRLKIAV